MYDVYTAKEFACEIVYRAIEDYREALKNLQNENPTYMDLMSGRTKIDAKAMKDDCEIFFESDWCELLSPVDGKRIMHIVREQMNWDEDRYQNKKDWWEE